MSSIDLFNEIVILRDKIDPQMQMDIWVKLFSLLPEPNDGNLQLSFDSFTNFLVNVATAAVNRSNTDNAALVSGHAAGVNAAAAPSDAARQTGTAPNNAGGGLFSVFAKRNRGGAIVGFNSNDDYRAMRKACQKILQYYTLNTTSTCEFKVGDLMSCLLYLSKMPNYRPLYNLLEQAIGDVYECVPNLTQDQMYHITQLLRNLLDLPNSVVDFNNVKLLRNTLNKVMNFPLTRFPRIMVLPSSNLSKDQRCTLEELILERGEALAKIEPQQFVEHSESSRIPFCDDEEFIHELLKLTENFDLKRMFYNTANSMFYTTMENYAVNNCKFDIEDYNNIFKTVDELKELSENCGLAPRMPSVSDSLNIYLNDKSKRKKY
nr:P40 [Calliteara abietis nucleopolyhedrovirus]